MRDILATEEIQRSTPPGPSLERHDSEVSGAMEPTAEPTVEEPDGDKLTAGENAVRPAAEEELRTRARQQASIAQLGQYALASNDLSALLHEAVALVAQSLDVELSAVWELLPDEAGLLLRAGVGWREGLVGQAVVPATNRSQPGYTLLSHGPVIVQDLHAETRFWPSPLLREHHAVSGVSVAAQGRDRPFAVLSAHTRHRRSFTPGDIHFLQAIAHVLSGAIERAKAEEERGRYNHLLATCVLQAEEEERKRMARDLHDGTVQAISTLLVSLDLLESRLPSDDEILRVGFERVEAIARRALEEARKLAHGLRPAVLDDLGLVAAVHALADEHMQTYCLQVEVEADPDLADHLSPENEIHLFRLAREALTNACRYAGASAIRLRLAFLDGDVAELTVEDNGKGFDLEEYAHPNRRSGMGLQSMRERAALLCGQLHVDTAPGQGTRIVLRMPVVRDPVPSRSRNTPADARSIAGTRILLVDDHTIFREGLRLLLDGQPGMTVVGEGEDGRQAVEMVEELHPDVVVMDVAMPNLNGFEATRQIGRRCPETSVVILTTHENREYLVQMVQVGAMACVLKRSACKELVSAIRAVVEGKSYISPTIAGLLLEDHRLRIDREGDDLLTEREREVLQLVAEGRSNQEIAKQLVVSVKTVEAHRAHIMRKLGVHDRADLVKYAIRRGMISAE